MTKQVTEKLKTLPYYKKITRKHRYGTPVKDKAWSILSDYVRMRDWLKYKTCISSGRTIDDWHCSDAGHYESMSGNGALLGFSDKNVHMQSKNDNQLSSMATGARYRDELVKRYGEKIIKEIADLKRMTVKADDWYFIERIEDIHQKFVALKKDYPFETFPNYL